MKKLSDREKTILTGRVYPVIQSCISNRYKIVIGYFAVIGFMFAGNELKRYAESGAILFLALIFTLFVIHNSINQWRNTMEQEDLEGAAKRIPWMNITSSVVMLLLIWGGYCFIKACAC